MDPAWLTAFGNLGAVAILGYHLIFGLPKILDIVRRKDALQDTLRRAQVYAAEAKAALEGLPASEERSALLTLTDRLLQRNT